MTLTIAIIIVTCLVSITSFNKPDQIDKLSFWPYRVSHNNQYYRYITSGFVHADWNHLFFNMLTLYFFGSVAESNMQMFLGGKVYYVILYVLGLVLPDVSTYFKYKDIYGYRSIGASGAVSAILFSSIFFEPWNTILVFFIPIWAIVYGGLFLGYSVYMSKRGGDGINHDAHFWGAVLGLVFPIVMRPELAKLFLEQLLRPFN
ncbi:rhomboid family intramembrane serine protease [Chitinophaga barathri]|uniref:Rhomboid family intramembrane serine protease n=1 Tax=Chitinophaga barathri TaxID=1647451 RepID=A0A3N4M862_9BACT|nr:rhomboid family intramembrane serine protease [Chitinophaga barathri]RPD39774.1 rhomboid family intramembrane serine protease [Chitinophaga barathri]